MPIYASDSAPAPESDFEPGRLDHLVIGNRGRLLDPRRTPVSVAGLRPDVGLFVVRIDGFEDEGACWEVPFEEVKHYQFARGSACTPVGQVRAFEAAIARFDRPLVIRATPEARAATQRRLAEQRERAAAWLDQHSRFLAGRRPLPDPEERRGDLLLWSDLDAFMTERGLADIDQAFAGQFVSNPYSGELVKGHRIVIAELGLVDYEGTVVRDDRLFDGAWSRERRAEHLLARMGILRALLERLGQRTVRLHRGLSIEGPVEAPRNNTFVSASFCRAVAESHFDAGGAEATAVLVSRPVPIERLVMTYLETEPMNRQFLEAEAVLLFDPADPLL